MRMHMIDPRQLCRQHLLGEHNELHKHRCIFERGHSIAGRRNQIEPLAMQARHDVLAAEMLRRGYRHESPYEQPDLSAYGDLTDWTVDPDDAAALLRERCPECAERQKLVGAYNAIQDSLRHWRDDYKRLDLFGGDECFNYVFDGNSCSWCQEFYGCNDCPLDTPVLHCSSDCSPYLQAEAAYKADDGPEFLAQRERMLAVFEREISNLESMDKQKRTAG